MSKSVIIVNNLFHVDLCKLFLFRSFFVKIKQWLSPRQCFCRDREKAWFVRTPASELIIKGVREFSCYIFVHEHCLVKFEEIMKFQYIEFLNVAPVWELKEAWHDKLLLAHNMLYWAPKTKILFLCLINMEKVFLFNFFFAPP